MNIINHKFSLKITRMKKEIFLLIIVFQMFSKFLFSQKIENQLNVKCFNIKEVIDTFWSEPGKKDTTHKYVLTVFCGYKYPAIKEGFKCLIYTFMSKIELLDFYVNLNQIIQKENDGNFGFNSHNNYYSFNVKGGKIVLNPFDYGINEGAIKKINSKNIEDDINFITSLN